MTWPSLASFPGRPELLAGAAALLSGLILVWALRRPRTAVVVATERRGARLGLLGLVGLAAVVAGAWAVGTDRVPLAMPLFASGFGIWIRLARRDAVERRSGPAARRTVGLAGVALNGTLLAGVLVVANVLAFRSGGRAIDFTRDRAFTLAPLTVETLGQLDRPARFTIFYGRENARFRSQYQRVRQLLELYRQANSRRVAIEDLDQFAEPDRFEALAARLPDVAVNPAGGVVIELGEGSGTDRLLVRNGELFVVQESPLGEADPSRFRSTFRGEDALTSALIRLREGERPLIAFTGGHGEPPVGPSDDLNRPGIRLWRDRLLAFGAQVVDVDLGREPVPEGTALLAIVGPRTPFRDDELVKVRAYLATGRPLLALVDPAGPSGLEAIFRSFGVEVGPGRAVDPSSCYPGQPNLVFAPFPATPRHPIADPLANQNALVASAGSIRAGASPRPTGDEPDFSAVAILTTGRNSWVEADPGRTPLAFDKGRDQPGPAVAGVAVATQPRSPAEVEVPRLVLFSTPSLADDPYVTVAPANLDLLTNAVNWLRGRPERGGIAPATHEALTLAIDPGLRSRLVIVPTILAVAGIVAVGLATYFARRA